MVTSIMQADRILEADPKGMEADPGGDSTEPAATWKTEKILEAGPEGIEAAPGGDATKECSSFESPLATAPAVTRKEWMSATVTTLDHTRDRAQQVQDALSALEQQEADRLAAQKAERRRQELLAEAAEKKRKEALAAEKEKRFREMQAEELKRQQDALARSKKAEIAELKAATANFKKMKQAELDAKEKERVMQALNHISQQVLDGVLECQHVASKLWGSLMLCEKRQKIRERRPQTELFRDHVDDALWREQQLLTTSREKLADLAKRGEALRSELQVFRIQLGTEESREKALRRIMHSNSAPQLPSGQADTPKDVLKQALAKLGEAAELPSRSASARAMVIAQCDLANADVITSLDRRKAELGELIKGLQDQRAGAEKTVGDAEKRIQRLRRHAQSTMETPRSSKVTDDQLSSAASLMVDLRSLKESLEVDLSNKYQALKIDESCRNLTKLKSGGHVSKMGQTMRKDGKQPRMVARRMEPAG
mmetsp:Transcript_54987/g.112259  ORF Transcript_54987/g.112259 Transcript_54987/m.112259 type:complete len:484 (+) Transcript_54987:83-1534(+)